MKPELYKSNSDINYIVNQAIEKLPEPQRKALQGLFEAMISLLADLTFDLHQETANAFLEVSNYLTIKKDFLIPTTSLEFKAPVTINSDGTAITVNGTTLTRDFYFLEKPVQTDSSQLDYLVLDTTTLSYVLQENGETSSGTGTWELSLDYDLTLHSLDELPKSIYDIPFIFNTKGFISWHSEQVYPEDSVVYVDSEEKTIADLSAFPTYKVEETDTGYKIKFTDITTLINLRYPLFAEVELPNQTFFERMSVLTGVDLSGLDPRSQFFSYIAIYMSMLMGPTIFILKTLINVLLGSELFLANDVVVRVDTDTGKLIMESGRVYKTATMIYPATGEPYTEGTVVQKGFPVDDFVVVDDYQNNFLRNTSIKGGYITGLDNYTWYIIIKAKKDVFIERRILIENLLNLLKPVYTRYLFLSIETLIEKLLSKDKTKRFKHSILSYESLGNNSALILPGPVYDRTPLFYLDDGFDWGDPSLLESTAGILAYNTNISVDAAVASTTVEVTIPKGKFPTRLYLNGTSEYEITSSTVTINIGGADYAVTFSEQPLHTKPGCSSTTYSVPFDKWYLFESCTYNGTTYTDWVAFWSDVWSTESSVIIKLAITFASDSLYEGCVGIYLKLYDL